MYIEKINGPEDVKKFKYRRDDSSRRRNASCIIKESKYSRRAFWPEFGMVEAIIALHYVFGVPKGQNGI